MGFSLESFGLKYSRSPVVKLVMIKMNLKGHVQARDPHYLRMIMSLATSKQTFSVLEARKDHNR